MLDVHLGLLPRGLRSLDLSGCHNISNQGLTLLPPSLEHLDISECFLVSDMGLRNLSGVVGRTRDEIEEEEREKARLAAEAQQREEAEAERRRRKGKDKVVDDDNDDDDDDEKESEVAPEVLAALPDLVSDDEPAEAAGGTSPQQLTPEAAAEAAVPSVADVGRQLLPVVENPPFPHLTTLRLHKCFAIASLEFLPRTLEELDISHLNLNFAGGCFASLPPSLKRLTVTYATLRRHFLFGIIIILLFFFFSADIIYFQHLFCFYNPDGHMGDERRVNCSPSRPFMLTPTTNTGTAASRTTACGTCRPRWSTWTSPGATSSPTTGCRFRFPSSSSFPRRLMRS